MELKSDIIRYLPKRKVKVNAFILGTQKGGTSALFDYLTKHPQVEGGKKKEVNFFNQERNFLLKEVWYHNNFFQGYINNPFKKMFFLDATPAYLNTKKVPRRIFDYNPNAKFLVLLRDPVLRAFSAWNMHRQFNYESTEFKETLIKTHHSGQPSCFLKQYRDFIFQNDFPKFHELVENEIHEINSNSNSRLFPDYVKRGIYVEQLSRYFEFFNRDQFLIIESNSFRENKVNSMKNIFNFLNIKQINLDIESLKPVHTRKYSMPIEPKTKELLYDFYKPYNEELYKLLGVRYDWDK